MLIGKHKGILKLELETDAEGLKKNARVGRDVPSLGALLHDVTALIKDTWTVKILHARREANGVAHCLAKYGLIMAEARCIYDMVPDCAAKPYNAMSSAFLSCLWSIFTSLVGFSP